MAKKTKQQKTAEKKIRKAAVKAAKESARKLRAASMQEVLKGNVKTGAGILGFAKGMKKNKKTK